MKNNNRAGQQNFWNMKCLLAIGYPENQNLWNTKNIHKLSKTVH